jgi:hypothetical protein
VALENRPILDEMAQLLWHDSNLLWRLQVQG